MEDTQGRPAVPKSLQDLVIPGLDNIDDEFNRGVNTTLECIKELPERDRLFITLYYYEHMSTKEISKVLDMPEENVAKLRIHILEQLKQAVRAKYEGS